MSYHLIDNFWALDSELVLWRIVWNLWCFFNCFFQTVCFFCITNQRVSNISKLKTKSVIQFLSYYLKTRTRVSYLWSGWNLIKVFYKKTEPVFVAKKLGWIVNWNERLIKLDHCLFFTKALLGGCWYKKR